MVRNLIQNFLMFLVISARDLEMWTCGDPIIDLELLKKHTVYTGDLTKDS